FDMDADVYGPEAKTPVFEAQQSDLYKYLEASTGPFLFTAGVARNLFDTGKGLVDLARDAAGTFAYRQLTDFSGGHSELAEQYFRGSADRLGAMASGLGRLAMDGRAAAVYYTMRLHSPGAAEQFYGAGSRR